MVRRLLLIFAFAMLAPLAARADDYQKTIDVFHKAGESGAFFNSAYGYAVFPTIGKGGIGIGGAYGKGRVYEKGAWIGDCSMKQATIGFQFGGQSYSQIIFLEDQRALKEFTSGSFEFGAEASAVAITAGAGAKASSRALVRVKTQIRVENTMNLRCAFFTCAPAG